MFQDVELKLKKKNKLLFSRDSQSLQDLRLLMEKQTHRTLVLWALDCASVTLSEFEKKYPSEIRLRTCLAKSESWARGEIKMPEARRAILDAHAVAKELNEPEYAALCHAIGHSGATVHVATHALGLPIYELTAIVLKQGEKNFHQAVSDKIAYYIERLLYWQENTDQEKREWATFLLKDDLQKNRTSNKRNINKTP